MNDAAFMWGMAAGFALGSAYWLLMFAWWERWRK
jgi:hypothetical protein